MQAPATASHLEPGSKLVDCLRLLDLPAPRRALRQTFGSLSCQQNRKAALHSTLVRCVHISYRVIEAAPHDGIQGHTLLPPLH
jgi:hypothetical protein